jgi:hypothetical protein
MAARHDDYHPEFGELPQSRGVPRALLATVIVGLIMIFLIGAGIVHWSGFGHRWPSVTTLREKLK